MTIALINVILVLIILGAAALYASRGAFAAVATFLIAFTAWMLTANYYTVAQWVILKIHSDTYIYSGGAALLFTYLVTFILLQQLAISFLEEHIQLNPAVQSLTGAVFGAMTGVLLAGVLVTAWFMMPGSAHYRNPDQKEPTVAFNVDEKILTVARFLANDRIPGSTAFDPGHTFMRTHTFKFVAPPSQANEPPRNLGQAGAAEEERRRLNLRREPDIENLEP